MLQDPLGPLSGITAAVGLLASAVCVLSGPEHKPDPSLALGCPGIKVFLTCGTSCQSLDLDLPPSSLPLLCVWSLLCFCQRPVPTPRPLHRPEARRSPRVFCPSVSHECPLSLQLSKVPSSAAVDACPVTSACPQDCFVVSQGILILLSAGGLRLCTVCELGAFIVHLLANVWRSLEPL